jgi:hypothetical protein
MYTRRISYPPAQFQQGYDMIHMTVYAAIRQESHQVNVAIILAGVFHRLYQYRVSEKRTMLYLIADPGVL